VGARPGAISACAVSTIASNATPAATSSANDGDARSAAVAGLANGGSSSARAKPLRVKVPKSKERALIREFGLDVTALTEEEADKRRSELKALVKMEGHEPTTVNDSLQAMEIARSVNPDLITLDLMMPGLTGFELCKLLHEDPKFINTPIVIVSAKDDVESKEQAKQAGATDYLTKPFGLDEFLKKIKPFVTNK